MSDYGGDDDPGYDDGPAYELVILSGRHGFIYFAKMLMAEPVILNR